MEGSSFSNNLKTLVSDITLLDLLNSMVESATWPRLMRFHLNLSGGHWYDGKLQVHGISEWRYAVDTKLNQALGSSIDNLVVYSGVV